MGATYTLKVTSRDSRALANEVAAILGDQADCTIECSGAEPSVATAIYVCCLGYLRIEEKETDNSIISE